MYFPEVNSRLPKELQPGVLARPFWGENLMLAVVNLDAEAVIPTHSHPHEQAGIVLEGEMDFTIAEETRHLTTGDIYLIPSNVGHSVRVGPAPARVMDIFNPVREEWKD